MKSFMYLPYLVVVGFCAGLSAATIDYVAQGAQEIHKQLPEYFFLERLLIKADMPICEQDDFCLRELKENLQVSAAIVENACFYLQQTRRWKDIDVQVSQGTRGFILVFNLCAHWLICSVKMRGVWFGKDALKRRCLLKGGEVFDMQKYQESMRRLVTYFKKMGYLQAKVNGRITRNEQRKHVAVTFLIDRGRLFSIKEARVRVIGKKKLLMNLDQDINKQLQTLKNKPYNHQLVKKFMHFLRRLLVHTDAPGAPINQHEKIVDKARVSLDFTVDASPEYVVQLRGNRLFSTQELFSLVLADNANLACPVVPFLMHGIKRHYHASGFLLASATAHYNEHGWRITIDEGEQMRICVVDFKGVAPIHVQQLNDLCKPLLTGVSIDEQLLQRMREIILTYFERNGFWRAHIVDQEYEPCRGGCRLIFTIDAGAQSFLKAVRLLTDMPAIERALQRGVLVVERPVPFDWSFIERDKQRLERMLQSYGVDGQVSYELFYEADGIVVVWHVIKKPITVFGDTVFIGAMSTKYKRVAAMLSYRAGQPFDVALLGSTFNNMSSEDIFDVVRVFPLQALDSLGRQPIGIMLNEVDPFEAQLRFGLIGTNNFDLSTYTAGFSLFGKNITSHMDTVTMNIEFTRFARDCTLWYRYPRVAGLPYTIHGRLFDKKTDVLCSQTNSCALYTALQRGLAVQADYSGDALKSVVSVGLEGIKVTRLFEPAAYALLFEPAMRNHYEPYIAVEPAFDVVRVDDVLNPRRGFMIHLGGRMMYALGVCAASFVRLLYEQSCFFPLLERLVGALRMRGGYIFCSSFEHIMPSERFYLGGACSVRSYQQDYMPPLVHADNGGCCLWMPLGSRIMASVNAEARLSLSKNVDFVIFQDVGFLKNERNAHWYVGGATGCGVRYITPIGPLRFDVGVKNNTAPDDHWPLAWFLTIGHIF